MGADRRYLLDTNIVLFFLHNRKELERHVHDILDDWNNLFYVSVASVQEMTILVNSGKISHYWDSTADILPSIDEANITLLPVKREHIAVYTALQLVPNHNDPFDHIIIAQAIAERMTLISSDTKFKHYAQQRLTLIENER